MLHCNRNPIGILNTKMNGQNVERGLEEENDDLPPQLVDLEGKETLENEDPPVIKVPITIVTGKSELQNLDTPI